eukprot:TRINITY_DN4332_c0_g1_i1.p1 TRINITY_DN4332_c0_g1~~TRINITY_DN4332_c0_g1_i1.p1  ORF type:complete len:942 (+),score=365.72 TRINITY_DN4332_c0_g1_i1:55-2880(+)
MNVRVTQRRPNSGQLQQQHAQRAGQLQPLPQTLQFAQQQPHQVLQAPQSPPPLLVSSPPLAAGAGASGAAPYGHVPELHVKMSKKIAQLTKVVYQLKTKYDDCERQLADVVAHYEEEMMAIVRDSTSRLQDYQKFAAVEQARVANEAVAESSKQLKQQHKEETDKVYTELEHAKKQGKEKEAAVIAQYGARIQALTQDLTQLREEYTARTREFTDTMMQLQTKHEAHVQQLVADDSAQLADAQSALRQDLQRQMAQADAAHAQQLEEERMQLQQELEQAAAKLQEQQQESAAALREKDYESDRRVADAEAALRRQLCEARDGTVKISQVQDQLERKVETLLAEKTALAAKCERLGLESASHWKGFQDERRRCDELVASLAATKKSLEIANEEASVNSTSLNSEIERRQQELEAGRAHEKVLEENLLHAEEDREQSDAEARAALDRAQAAAAQHAAALSTLQHEYSDLQSLLDGKTDELRLLTKKVESLSAANATLQSEILRMQTAHTSEASALEESHTAELQRARTESAKAQQQQQAEAENLRSLLKKEEEQKDKAVTEGAQLSLRVEQLEIENTRLSGVEKLYVVLQTQQDSTSKQINTAESRLHALVQREQELLKQVARLSRDAAQARESGKQKVTQLTKEADAKLKAADEQVQQLQSELAVLSASKDAEMRTCLAQAEQREKANSAKTTSYWQALVEQKEAALTAALRAKDDAGRRGDEASSELSAQLEQLQHMHEEQQLLSEAQLREQATRADTAERRAAGAEQRADAAERRADALRRERDEAAVQGKALRQEMDQSLAKLRAECDATVAKTGAEAGDECRKQVESLRSELEAAHTTEVSQLQEQHAKELAQRTDEHTAEVARLQQDFEHKLLASLEDREQEWARKQAQQLDRQRLEATNTRLDSEEAHKAVVRQLTQRIADVTNEITDLQIRRRPT